MRLPINIEEPLSGRAVEGDRIEYKTGWNVTEVERRASLIGMPRWSNVIEYNPDAIYRTICAFANDFDETGGGYIVVGVKEVNGRAIRPVIGIDPKQVEPIEKDMVGFNNLIRPYYQPRLYIEEADGKTILVIKVSPGERRPYMKELDLTEGRATGIPTIQEELEANGSPSAKIETDDERTYFLIDIPCHPYFVNKAITIDSSGANDGNVTKDVTKDVTKELTDRQRVIVEMIKEDAYVTTYEMSQKTGVVTRTIKRDLEYLQSAGIIIRIGGRKDGHWEVLT